MNNLICNSGLRREKVRQHNTLNGLDYLEVGRIDQLQPDLENQRHLRVYFLGKAPVKQLDKTNIRIEGGRRIRDIQIVSVVIHQSGNIEFDDSMEIQVDKAGDFSTYTLRVVEKNEQGQWQPHSAFDRRYDRIEFSFKVDCPNDFDCKSSDTCPAEPVTEPDINYLAKDYASFRQLILDRLALLMPEWRERHIPDIGVALVEVLAYVGDHLSYYQDAVATEAYLDTARQRLSVRRHARLVDYQMHEGCNARAWVCVEVKNTDLIEIKPEEIYFITGFNETLLSGGGLISEEELQRFSASQYEVFEPLSDPLKPKAIQLYKDHSSIKFYTWGEQECCLPRGSTSATLVGIWIAPEITEPEPHCDSDNAPVQQKKILPVLMPENQSSKQDTPPKLHLRTGDILIFHEVKGPKTGHLQDADPEHRHAVRLIRIEADVDPLNDQAVVNISWAEEDALPFPLCLSALGSPPDCMIFHDVSIACGNVILVDHGKKRVEELGPVPKKTELHCCIGEGIVTDSSIMAGRYNPELKNVPLTFSQPLSVNAPASFALKQDVQKAIPQIKLMSMPAGEKGCEPLFSWVDLYNPPALINSLKLAGSRASRMLLSRLSLTTRALIVKQEGSDELSVELKNALQADLLALLAEWLPQYDLLGSDYNDRHFVVETDNNRRAHIRFGNGGMGLRPEAGMSFQARYRAGNGSAGNVGAGAISHLVWPGTTLDGSNIKISNPLPAQGGTEPESVAEVKLFAPGAFRKQLQRAVIADDYAEIVLREFNSKVQGAAAKLRWTGSWYEVLTSIDPFGREAADDALITQVTEDLHRYRRMGHDLVVKSARRVPLDIKLSICVSPDYLRGHVKAELLSVFSNKLRANGQRGLFHPDELKFGDDVYLSKLVAVAQAVEGVESVEVITLQRLQEPANNEIENGVLLLGPYEIARCDNDPGFPEFGRVELDMRGGR